TLTFFFFNNTATTDTHTLSLHDALPISFGLREPELLAHHIRAEHHRDHLIARMPASHALAPHAAVGRNDQPLGGNVLERLANERSDLVRSLNLQRVMVDHANHHLLVLAHFSDGLEIASAGSTRLEGQGVGI